jgi:hypothetical protein
MPCRRCGQKGHNIRTCKAIISNITESISQIEHEEHVSPSESVEVISLPEDEPGPEFDISAPDDWGRTENSIITLPVISPEYKKIHKDFIKSFSINPSIIFIQRLQHPVKFMQYQLEKQRMALRDKCPVDNVKELTLYHGTSEDAVESINKNGFNRSFGSVQAYGDGIYFARDAILSSSYKYAKPDTNGHQVVYVTKVLVGHSTLGKGGMKIPPDRKPGVPYDSLVNSRNNPTIYVSGHNDNQMYGQYLVKFKSPREIVQNFPRYVGHIEIQNMDDIEYNLYWIPHNVEVPPLNTTGQYIYQKIIRSLKSMKTISNRSKSYQNVGGPGHQFIVTKLGRSPSPPGQSWDPHVRFVGKITYKDNPHKKMSFAIADGSLISL